MFSSKPHINILTSALHAYGIEHIIVCAGARNGILVHNFNTSGLYTLHGAVDERSAAFMAIGMILATNAPVCVCVTSGSALLGCLPATAEAYYRQLPLLVLSADRPAEWIDRLDGQTIPQVGALEPYARTFNIEELSNDKDSAQLEVLIKGALQSLWAAPAHPVHINVPIHEPLFTLGGQAHPFLGEISRESRRQGNEIQALSPNVIERINAARLPALIIGQYEGDTLLPLEEIETEGKLLVLPELLANCKNSWRTAVLEKALCTVQNGAGAEAEDLELPAPDLIIHLGLNSVHKRLRTYLRSLHCDVIRISENNDQVDTFSAHTLTGIRCSLPAAINQLAEQIRPNTAVKEWQKKLLDQNFLSKFNKQEAGATYFKIGATDHASIEKPNMISVLQALMATNGPLSSKNCSLHLANSSIVREACNFFDGGMGFSIHCNRGTNGIEGSVSAAAGQAIASPNQRTILLTGDLSFLYDQNGLWSHELGGNLRIIVFNDGGGGIFHHMPALSHISERHSFISAPHCYSAGGTAETFNLTYLSLRSRNELSTALQQWWSLPSSRPVVLEVFI